MEALWTSRSEEEATMSRHESLKIKFMLGTLTLREHEELEKLDDAKRLRKKGVSGKKEA